MSGVPRLECAGCVAVVGYLEERRRKVGRGEGEKVEGDEEELIKSAADEEEGLS
jgi:hypothetical protein